jgi:hypothetical protein
MCVCFFPFQISSTSPAFLRSSYHLSQCQLIPKAWTSGLKRSGFEFTQAQLLLMLLKQNVPVSFCFSFKSNPFARPASLCALYSHVAALVTGALTLNLRCFTWSILLSSSVHASQFTTPQPLPAISLAIHYSLVILPCSLCNPKHWKLGYLEQETLVALLMSTHCLLFVSAQLSHDKQTIVRIQNAQFHGQNLIAL